MTGGIQWKSKNRSHSTFDSTPLNPHYFFAPSKANVFALKFSSTAPTININCSLMYLLCLSREGVKKIRAANSASARKDKESELGFRDSAFLDLPYFNIIRQTIVDPMHNLFSGKNKSTIFRPSLGIYKHAHQLPASNVLIPPTLVITSCVSGKGYIFGSVCVSVCLAVCLFALFRLNRWTYGLKIWHVH